MKTTIIKFFIPLFIIFSLGFISPEKEEGMYPLSEIHKLDLVKAGLKINPHEIYNPNGISLIDALVNIGGCTGSFVSDKGLIITNHHCAFGAISAASTVENNLLENGFYAASLENEIPAKGYKCRITESYEDVSKIILDEADKFIDPIQRNNAIAKKISELEKNSSDQARSIEARVSEMFPGKTYILFKYRVIEDVRLVFAPPRSIGEFGGETDNWVWPRHTGDFSFMRAYVAPDGSSKPYDKSNVPFKPKRFLKINPNGVDENDFVFILGYPGRTFRNYPYQYLQYQDNYLLPYTSELYDWIIRLIETVSKDDEAMQLKFASYIKGLANTMKNYKGKIKGLKKINLVDKKRGEDQLIKNFFYEKNKTSSAQPNIFEKLDNSYEEMNRIAMPTLWFERIARLSNIYQIYSFLIQNSKQLQLDDSLRLNQFKSKNYQTTLTNFKRIFSLTDEKIDFEIFNKFIFDALDFSENSRISAVDQFLSSTENTSKLSKSLIDLGILDKEKFDDLLKLSPEELSNLNPVAFKFFNELMNQKNELDNSNRLIRSELNMLLPIYISAKQEWQNKNFIPDANSTLRLTYGHVKGYSPADALYYKPFTTINGVIEKSYQGNEFQLPEKYYDLVEAKNFGKFYNKKLNSVPVALLYNTDTTGGNSGSPILNAYGELIGVNFDRTFEATINDFAWDESYSRSIGVDIRYVLWVTSVFGNATNLISELGI
ncbi:MAG: S46 family peptidase [Ignavibacteriales bacterium]